MEHSASSQAVLLTPPGAAAIAVVRVAGPRVRPFLESRFARPAKTGRCVHGDLRDGEKVLDDPVVVLHEGGVVADINLHGGPWVVASVLELLRRDGFEVVEAGAAGPSSRRPGAASAGTTCATCSSCPTSSGTAPSAARRWPARTA